MILHTVNLMKEKEVIYMYIFKYVLSDDANRYSVIILISITDERNLILLGGPEENLHTTYFLEKLPISFKGNQLLTLM